MKKFILSLLCLFVLTGCGSGDHGVEPMMRLRSRIQQQPCAFRAKITADYGNKTHTFAMGCQFDAHGNLSFTVLEPESICGVTGKIEGGKGSITFEETALAFELLTDDQLSPISAPWIFFQGLRGGYMVSGGEEGAYYHVTVNDSYQQDALQVDVWLTQEDIPVQAEILWKERKILTIEVTDFVIG